MPFRYACFISYCHGQYDLTKQFIEQLKHALKSELEPMLDEEVYIDEERLRPGYRYNEALATAICESICMIVVYSPRYERHPYCLQEYSAMEALERRRIELLGPGVPRDRGFIIPVVFRGDIADLPPRIRNRLHCCDFSRFTLATSDLSRNPEYVADIRRMAQVIYEHYRAFDESHLDPCSSCSAFELPSVDSVSPWRGQHGRARPLFPGREHQE
jgi:hypothetical protein